MFVIYLRTGLSVADNYNTFGSIVLVVYVENKELKMVWRTPTFYLSCDFAQKKSEQCCQFFIIAETF